MIQDFDFPISVSLTQRELMVGANHGVLRNVVDIKESRHGVNEQPKEKRWQVMIEGALAEIAVAKAFGIYWSGAIDRGHRDTKDYEVRMSYTQKNRLWLYNYDPDNLVYLFVTGLEGNYTLQGWVYGFEGKKPEYWQKVSWRPAAYYVPNEKLNLTPLPVFDK